MANHVSAHCVGDFFLLQTDQNAGDAITNLKLQKLCYYAQAWHCALEGSKLFDSRIEAWAHGPVIPELYHRFKKYKWNAIDPTDVITDPYADLHESDIGFLESIWDRYGRFTGKQLENMTHNESPWLLARGDRKPGQRCEAEITPRSMREYYRERLAVAA